MAKTHPWRKESQQRHRPSAGSFHRFRVKIMTALIIVSTCGLLWYSKILLLYEEKVFAASSIDHRRYPKITGWLVNSSTCMIPDYDPWDPTIAQVIGNETPFPGCRQAYRVRMQQQGNALFMFTNSSAQKQSCEIECCYRSVTRIDKEESDDTFEFGTTSTCFKGEPMVKVADQFINVRCFCRDDVENIIHEDFHAFIFPSSDSISSQLFKSKLFKHDKLSVYLIGIDSTSHLNFKRFLPDVEQLLANEFDAVPMHGMTKIGANSFQNLLALLVGYTMDRLDQSLSHGPFDNLPLIWKQFSRLGYVTMLAEDDASRAPFNFHKRAFYKQPTDFYSMPFSSAIAESGYPSRVAAYCVNQRTVFDIQLQWLQDFMTYVEDAAQFGLLFSSSLNTAQLTHVKAIQSQLVKFLQWYRQSERYDSSVLILFSGRGADSGPVMRHELGSHESRLPLFYMALPPWYRRRYPDRVRNLRANSHRLTTLLDAHATLRDLLRDAGGAAPADVHGGGGVSLFRPVPAERSCATAGVGGHWCVCRSRRSVDVDSAGAQMAAAAAVRHMNRVLLRPVRRWCAILRLLSVTAAHDQTAPGSPDADDEHVVRLVVTPGLSQFEATVRSHADGRSPTVVGVSRLNAYMDQSDCLPEHPDQRRFCVCV